MSKVIIIHDDSLENYYERTMDYLHNKYHNYPSNLPKTPLSAEAQSRQSFNTAMGRNAAANADIDPDVPLGKQVL